MEQEKKRVTLGKILTGDSARKKKVQKCEKEGGRKRCRKREMMSKTQKQKMM